MNIYDIWLYQIWDIWSSKSQILLWKAWFICIHHLSLPSFLSRLSPRKLWPTWRIRGPGLAMCDHMSMRTEWRKELSSFVTPPKINMEHHHGGLEDLVCLSKWVICRFHVNLPGCISKIQVKRFLHMDGERAQARPVRWSTRRKQAKDMSCFASWHKKQRTSK